MGTIDLNHLVVFAAVAETGSFTEAARRLGTPKSTVSRAVAALEAELGVRLLHRTTRNVTLTTAGRALFERTHARIQALSDAVADLPELEEEPAGALRVTAAVDFGAEVLAPIVAAFCRRYPRVTVDMHLSPRAVDLVKEGFDAAFRMARAPLPDSALISRRVGDVRLQLYAAPAYLAARGAPRRPEELADHDVVAQTGTTSIVLEEPTPVTVAVRPRITSDDMFYLRAALRHGAGIGALPTPLAEADARAGTLVRVLPRWSMPTGTIWLLVPSGRNIARKLEVFRDFVVEALRARDQ